MKTIFLTGLNGLLGTNICHELLDSNFKVIGLLRNKKKYFGKIHSNLKIIEGDLFDDFKIQFEKIDCIIHTAAITDQNILNYNTYKKINCSASLHLIKCAIESEVKQFIFVSSANTIQNNYCSKTDAYSFISKSFYAKSKKEAENDLLQYKDKINITIINPTFMIGAYDSKPSSGKIILMGWKKKIVFYPPGGKNFIHVQDVSTQIVKLINTGISGKKYLLANKDLSYKEFYNLLNTVTQQNPTMIQIPEFFLIALGYLGNILRTFRIKSSLNSTNAKILCTKNYFSNNMSIMHLHLNLQSIDKAIIDAVDYYAKNKL